MSKEMTRLRVVAPMGVCLQAPLTIKLSQKQHAVRQAVLGTKFKRQFDLDAGELSFKYGEEFSLADMGKLHKDHFEDLDAKAAAEAEAKAEIEAETEAEAEVEAEAKDEGAAE